LKKLGKYEVLGELGHGAMGVVYRARDPIINRLVALKTITTGLAEDPLLLERFYREAQSAGGLQHPNIVTIHDLGEAGGVPYIAMELVDGENLDQLVARRSPISLTLKLVYSIQACRAFDYAHKRGIVHRDIKPGNVMVSKDGVVKVVDFGIARVLENSRTQTGMLIGTFAYMSPEQYHGEHADERSDIWSFGVLLFELFCYQKPFMGPTPASLMHSICSDECAVLSKYLPDCPRELELTVSKMLRKSPTERYQSMEDVLLDLDAVCKTLQSQAITGMLIDSQRLFEERRFAETRDLVRQVLQIDSANQQARALLEKANAELKRELNRPKVQQYVERGQTLLSEGKLQEARLAAENALQLDSRFAAAEDLQRAVLKELEQARLLSESLEAAKQYVAEGLPDEAETLLAKILQTAPAHEQAKLLLQQVQNEKSEREKRHRLLQSLQHARELWTRQHYAECLTVLQNLGQEFPAEEEVSRLLDTVREDQLEQQKQQGLLDSKNLLAAGRHEECLAVLALLQQQFPHDEEISSLLEDVRKDQMNQRCLAGLAEARSLLATGDFEPCISLLSSLRHSFPDEQEIPSLLETARLNQVEQHRQHSVNEARKLLAGRRYEECNAVLSLLEKEFPVDEEIRNLKKTVRDEQAERQKQQLFEKARRLLDGRHYDECTVLLGTLEKQFPADAEVRRLQDAVREERAKQRKLQSLEEARNLLGSKNYEKAVALLFSLQQEFTEDPETRRLLESARKEQAEERKRDGLAQARNLLVARHYDESIQLLNKLRTDFPDETAISKLLESARKEQAEQYQREGLSQARDLLASRRYDESITLLNKLQADFPAETEIAKLLTSAYEDLAEQQKQQKLTEARNLLAAESFENALTVLDPLVTKYPKDSVVAKLHKLVHREKEKHAKVEKLTKELDTLKKLMSDKKYPEVIARTKELLVEFPGDANLLRLAEFAKGRQASIEKELLFNKTFEEAQAFFRDGRFEEAIGAVQTGLKTFPGNADLQNLRQQAEIQQKKLQVRRQIEQRIREIKVRINREELSEAIDLAKQTLVTMGPDTDITHLLNSAQVEYTAREKKKTQEQTLLSIHSLLESGDLDAANKTIDELLESKNLDSFDPRVQRLSELIKDAATDSKVQPPVASSFSKEYAFLQSAPPPSAPPSAETSPPADSPTAQLSATSTAPTYAAPNQTTPPSTLESSVSSPQEKVVERRSPSAASPVRPEIIPSKPTVVQVGRRQTPSQDIPGFADQLPVPAQPELHRKSIPTWRKPAVLAIIALAFISAVWAGLRSARIKSQSDNATVAKPESSSNTSAKPESVPAVAKPVEQPPKPRIDPLETQQRQSLKTADSMIAADNLNAASNELQEAAKLNGPLNSEIQKKLAEIDESRKNSALKQLRHTEQVLWQRAMTRMASQQYAEAQSDLQKIVALPDGGVHREEAQGYIDNIIPQQKAQNSLVIETKQKLAKGDFRSARSLANQLRQKGGNPAELLSAIDRAENTQLKQFENQFDQLRQREDESAVQQLKEMQPKLQALASDGGPQSAEAQTYANRIPAAMADIHSRLDKKNAEAVFQQIVKRYQQATTNHDNDALQALRGDFQSVVAGGGPFANNARQYLTEIDKRIEALKVPVTAPPAVTKEAPATTTQPPPTVTKEARNAGPQPATVTKETRSPAGDEAAIRAVIQNFFQSWERRNPNALRQVWPGISQKKYDGYKNSFENAKLSSIVNQVTGENVKILPGGAKATVDVQSRLEETQKGAKKPSTYSQSWVFSLSRIDGTWVISDAQ
jgi:serine/threonine protein kinase